jgi:DNA-binding LacI/PurR family transcriptional regulator
MNPLSQPHRAFLADQVAAILRHEIAARRWREWLPGERALAQTLNVSRPTLRAALQQLVAAREIEVHSRDGYAIRQQAPTDSKSKGAPSLEIGLICPERIYSLPSHVVQLVDLLRARCAEAGLHLEIFEGRRFARNDLRRIMPRMVEQRPKSCWIAIMAGRPLQEWFMRTGAPAVIYGNTYPTIELPSVGIDYRACIRHATALLLSRGHRRIALVNYDAQRAGDQESLAGFNEAFQAHGGEERQPVILSRPDDDVNALRRQIDRLVRSTPRTTAIIVGRSHHYATVATHLAERGCKIPDDISLICRGEDTFLHFLCPAPAHYRVNLELLSRRLFRCIQRAIDGAHRSRETYRMVPEFVPGGSVGRPATARLTS